MQVIFEKKTFFQESDSVAKAEEDKDGLDLLRRIAEAWMAVIKSSIVGGFKPYFSGNISKLGALRNSFTVS